MPNILSKGAESILPKEHQGIKRILVFYNIQSVNVMELWVIWNTDCWRVMVSILYIYVYILATF